ncbi:hypothetical protein VTI74DRAFT_10184 [Chaetomium olivicolor]
MPLRRFLSSLAQEFQGAAYNGNWGSQSYDGFGAGGYGIGQSSQIPQASAPCPRQQPQAGHRDWIGLNDARFSLFNVCPTCYNSAVRPTPYANAFITKAGALAVPSNVAVRCDMSRFWVRVAGMVLLTMNQDRRHDITLLARVAGIVAQDGKCPNSQLVSEQQPLATTQRTWYTVQDPQTGAQPLPGWTVCGHCVLNIQACCPSVAPAWAPLRPEAATRASCAMVPSDCYDDTRTMQILQQIGGCAVSAAILRRPDLSQLIGWLRANPPPPRGGSGLAHPSSFPGMGAAAHVNGLCPRNIPSTTLRCYTMQGLVDFTVCEQCYSDVIRPDVDNGISMARQFDADPSAIASGFTCQLYSDRMRQVWREAASTGNLAYLQQKVSERRMKERDLQMKTMQFRQQANQFRIQAQTQEHLAANAFRVAANSASNNIMLAGIGAGYRVDANHIAVPSGVADFSQSTQLNNQAAMLKIQAAQAEDHIRFAEEEWKRFWE